MCRAYNTRSAQARQERELLLQRAFDEFRQRYETDEACTEETIRLIEDVRPSKCGKCGGAEFERDFGARQGWCQNCGEKVRPTAGTFFEGARLLFIWRFLIEVHGSGHTFNAAEFHRVTGVAASTIGQMLKKINFVINRAQQAGDSAGDPAGDVHTESFLPVYCRRSLVTSRIEGPASEQTDYEREHETGAGLGAAAPLTPISVTGPQLCVASAPDPLGKMTPEEHVVLGLLSHEPIELVDLEAAVEAAHVKLSTLPLVLTKLELRKLVVEQFGYKYVLANQNSALKVPAKNKNASTNLSEKEALILKDVCAFIDYIRENFGGISRKYLDLYLAFYWCFVDRKRWGINAVLDECVKFGRVKSIDLRNFLTPLYVKLAHIQ